MAKVKNIFPTKQDVSGAFVSRWLALSLFFSIPQHLLFPLYSSLLLLRLPPQNNFRQAQERRRRIHAVQDPYNSLMVEGRACKILRQGSQLQQLEDALMPCLGRKVGKMQAEIGAE